MKQFIRTIFKVKPFERALTFLLGIFPGSSLRFAVSSNNDYPAGSIRFCKRYGISYCLDINDYQNWLLYFYSGNDSSFGVLKYLEKEKMIFDVGGNIGQTALMMAKDSMDKTTIYSFEPYPPTYARFQKNLELNPALKAKIKLQQVGLGSISGKVKMHEACSTNSGANRIMTEVGDIPANTIEVPVSTIDIFAAENKIQKIDFIKIDVEGFEMEVLKGAHVTLIKDKPSLFVEVDDANLKKQGSSAIALCEYLEQMGYAIYEEGKKTLLHSYKIGTPINIYCSSKNI